MCNLSKQLYLESKRCNMLTGMENFNFDDGEKKELFEKNTIQKEQVDKGSNNSNEEEHQENHKEVVYLTPNDNLLQILKELPNSVLVVDSDGNESIRDEPMLLQYTHQNNINVEKLNDDTFKTKDGYSLWEAMHTTISETDYEHMNTIRNFIQKRSTYSKNSALYRVSDEINNQHNSKNENIRTSRKSALYSCLFYGDEELSKLSNMLSTQEEILKAEYYKRTINSIQEGYADKNIICVVNPSYQQLLRGKTRSTDEQLQDEKSLLAQKEKIETSTRHHIIKRYTKYESAKWTKDSKNEEYNIRFGRELGIVDQHLLARNTEQLINLINIFPYAKRHIKENGLLISAKDLIFSGMLAYVPSGNLLTSEITMDLNRWETFADLVKEIEYSVEVGFSMPCAKDMIDVYTITHEFGHIIHNILTSKFVSEKLAGKKQLISQQHKTEPELTKNNSGLPTEDELIVADLKDRKYIAKLQEKVAEMHITKIINMIDQNFSVKMISHYARSPMHRKNGAMYKECFAEIFANSQCGAPNALGIAMNKYLIEILK